mmetsp:Transcript_487/g.639  ORF Transcript_487/g.639 Transcript_487/m.639 type:complete len:365 (-) Transcript_487:214-1308(-)
MMNALHHAQQLLLVLLLLLQQTTTLTLTNTIIRKKQPPQIKWEVYVSMSKQCKSLGSAATLAAFLGLSPPDMVQVQPAKFNVKSKTKGPNVRCLERTSGVVIEVGGCDSVEKVYRVLSVHMGLKKYLDPAACECLKWNYRGNAHLDNLYVNGGGNPNKINLNEPTRSTEITKAIRAYNKALATGYKPQEGVLLVMRATAYLQRAFEHRKKLKEIVASLVQSVPDPVTIQAMYDVAYQNPWAANAVFERVRADAKAQDARFRRLKFRHGLYEYALLHAASDSLRATQLLPQFAKTWLRAGDSLAELRKLKESTQYYEKALELDPQLEETLLPTIDRLQKSQKFLDKARANGWSEDTLRVALDVAG